MQMKTRKFQAAVAKQLIVLDYYKEQLAQMLRMSRSTLWNRLNNPAEFRVCELTALHDILKFSDEERHILL